MGRCVQGTNGVSVGVAVVWEEAGGGGAWLLVACFAASVRAECMYFVCPEFRCQTAASVCVAVSGR